ncbi:hypothetical protein CTAYLR_005292 [Chrysophaeum taylorii]|uniref:Uncharacterized protein n=1 Tax=Chrysophaeum taylorii TaxID=2483200 RepID=A0AAD7UJ58_9STRA|nr:hypothetical protein CTAYLR_005292 [Chrysophaeum taylorii]
MDTEARARIRRLASENEQLKLRLARCGCGRGSRDTSLARALEENERLRSQLKQGQSPAMLAEALGIHDIIRRYRRALRAAHRRISQLEAALAETRSSRRTEETAATILERAVECLQAAKSTQEQTLKAATTRPHPMHPDRDDNSTDGRCAVLRSEIGGLDAEITMLRAALRDSTSRKRGHRPHAGDDDARLMEDAAHQGATVRADDEGRRRD